MRHNATTGTTARLRHPRIIPAVRAGLRCRNRLVRCSRDCDSQSTKVQETPVAVTVITNSDIDEQDITTVASLH